MNIVTGFKEVLLNVLLQNMHVLEKLCFSFYVLYFS